MMAEEKKDDSVFELVAAELASAMANHRAFNSSHEGLAVLLEEFEELKHEVFQRDQDAARMREEAVQVAAMAIRFLVDVCGVRLVKRGQGGVVAFGGGEVSDG